MNEEPARLTVLVIEDEPQMRRLLRATLEASDYRVFEAVDGESGIAEAVRRRPDLLLLDLGLPDIDGLEVLKRIRGWSSVPISVLTVRESEEDKIQALDSGADDYITKPFSSRELLARMRVAQRHVQSSVNEPVFKSGPLTVDLAARTALVNGKHVKLTMTEFALLRLFVSHAGKVLTNRQIMQEVWGPANLDRTNYLHVYIAHLRAKLEADPANPKLLVNEMRVGYRLMILE
jgi:two-component system, OmpR family, KDP operon response regulator KdpE